MWTANLLYKQERTDGGIDFNMEFTDGTRKFQKTLTFFSAFDLGQAVKNQIVAVEALYQTADAILPGTVAIPVDKAPQVNQVMVDIQILKKLQSALTLGLVDQATVDAQAAIVKQDPNFLNSI